MSYPRELKLDEYTDQELEGEIERRKVSASINVCYYCGCHVNAPPCKFPELHCSALEVTPEPKLEDRFQHEKDDGI